MSSVAQTPSGEPAEAFGLPPTVVRYSELGDPVETRPWWAPAGWLLIGVVTVVTYAVLIALAPLMVVWALLRKGWARRLRWRRDPASLRVAIVGAGWSGLQCLDRFRGIGMPQVDVYERSEHIGGTWSPELRYHGLQIHGSMTVTSFDGLPYSDDFDVQHGKVMGEEVERYIHRFADARELTGSVHTSSEVATLAHDSASRTATLEIRDPRTGETRTTGPYDLVIWASMAASGEVPRLPGADRFLGRQRHTTGFSTAEFEEAVSAGRRIVVVGGGKAACDIVLGLTRAGHNDFTWVMRKPYLFYRFEALLHAGAPKDRIRGVTYLATVLWTGASRRLGAILHWSSGHLATFGEPHTDFGHFHGGVLCATQRRELRGVPYSIGDPVGFEPDGLRLADGRTLQADLVIWATGNRSGIDELRLVKDGAPFALSPKAKLFHHFVVPDLPTLASSTALWTTFGPMRATNAADLAAYLLAVQPPVPEAAMARAARRQLSANSIVHSFIWARGACWLQQWVHFHIDLVLQGITPIDAFFKHAIEVFVLARETPLRFDLLPRRPFRT